MACWGGGVMSAVLIWAATDEELGGADAEEFWQAFDRELFRLPRKWAQLPLGKAVLCSEDEHDDLMRVVRHLPGRDCRPLRVWL